MLVRVPTKKEHCIISTLMSCLLHLNGQSVPLARAWPLRVVPGRYLAPFGIGAGQKYHWCVFHLHAVLRRGLGSSKPAGQPVGRDVFADACCLAACPIGPSGGPRLRHHQTPHAISDVPTPAEACIAHINVDLRCAVFAPRRPALRPSRWRCSTARAAPARRSVSGERRDTPSTDRG